MSVWILKQALNAQEEAQIMEHTDLVLPFEGLPDLTHIHTPHAAMKLLEVLYPDAPPETLKRRHDRFWHNFTNLQMGDLIAVLLPVSRRVAIAEVSGHYHYRVGEHGSDIHLIPVRWATEPVPLTKFGKHKKLFEEMVPMFEVMDPDTRTIIRDRLPHSYNRFVKLKWLIALFFIINLIAMAKRL